MAQRKILFIHHSTGANLIKEGRLRDEIKKLDSSIELWDHGYNLYPSFPFSLLHLNHHTGLTDNEGRVTGKDYNIILSNNSPKEYADIFSRNPSDPTLKSILGYDLIAFKNCYPTTRITSDGELEEKINYYKNIHDSLTKYPEKQFIFLTPPPARKETTTLENAKRAKKLVEWLKTEKFLQGISHIHVFDFFGKLADEDGFLKEDYTRILPWDSHPNKKANREVAPALAKYLFNILSQ